MDEEEECFKACCIENLFTEAAVRCRVDFLLKTFLRQLRIATLTRNVLAWLGLQA